MRYFNQGSCFRVEFSVNDVDSFARRWPCFPLTKSGWFEFNSSGDLIDLGGRELSQGIDGDGIAAFAEDCKAYGMKRRIANNA